MKMKPQIMIVDDDRDFRISLEATLIAHGYDTIAVGDRLRAQEAVREEKPDLVVLGTIAPRGEAFRLHQWLHANPSLHALPILVIDVPLEKQLVAGWTKAEGLRLAAEDYLLKPVEPASLLPRIEKLLDTATKRIRVLVVDDHPIVREGICALLSLQKDMQVIGQADNGRDALDKVLELAPDVVVMDVVMPIMNGLEATRQICRECKQAKVLMLTQYDSKENYIAGSQAGAYGVVAKRSASSQLLAGIRSVSQGKQFVSAAAS